VKGRDVSTKLLFTITAGFVGDLNRTLDACAAEFGFDSNAVISVKDVLDSMDGTDAEHDDYSREELRGIFVRAYALREVLPGLVQGQQLDLAIATTARYAFAVGCLADSLLSREDRDALLGIREKERVREEKVSERQKRIASKPRPRGDKGRLNIPTQKAVEDFRRAWLKSHGTLRGFRTAAGARFGVHRKTISRLIEKTNGA